MTNLKKIGLWLGIVKLVDGIRIIIFKPPQVGLEPTTNRLTADRSTPELLRTVNLKIYYSFNLERVTRFERATSTLARLRSTPELHPL